MPHRDVLIDEKILGYFIHILREVPTSAQPFEFATRTLIEATIRRLQITALILRFSRSQTFQVNHVLRKSRKQDLSKPPQPSACD
jgi:hypothetical protein